MPRLNASVPERIKASVLMTASGCWDWQRKRDRHGYGHIKVGGRDILAHRASYEAFVAEIPAGLTIDHLCKNTACVNPLHLEPVTNRENILRSDGIAARSARLTSCHRGHPFDEQNTYRDARGSRHCRACNRIRSLKYKRSGDKS